MSVLFAYRREIVLHSGEQACLESKIVREQNEKGVHTPMVECLMLLTILWVERLICWSSLLVKTSRAVNGKPTMLHL